MPIFTFTYKIGIKKKVIFLEKCHRLVANKNLVLCR